MRKPDPNFYQYVLAEMNIVAREAFFFDDKKENVAAAKSLGMNAIVFDDITVESTLRKLFDSPVARGHQYLLRHAKCLNSVTDSGVAILDNFAQLLILSVTSDRYVKHT